MLLARWAVLPPAETIGPADGGLCEPRRMECRLVDGTGSPYASLGTHDTAVGRGGGNETAARRTQGEASYPQLKAAVCQAAMGR